MLLLVVWAKALVAFGKGAGRTAGCAAWVETPHLECRATVLAAVSDREDVRVEYQTRP
jgi:hypothetical protein